MTNDGSYIIIENAAIYTYSYHIYLIYSLLHAKMTGKRKTQSHETKEQMSYDQLVEDDREFEPCLTSTTQYKKRNAIHNNDQPMVNINHKKCKMLTSDANLILEYHRLSPPQENTNKLTSALGFRFPYSLGELDFSSDVRSTSSSRQHTYEQIKTTDSTSQSNNPSQHLHIHGEGHHNQQEENAKKLTSPFGFQFPFSSGQLDFSSTVHFRDYANSETTSNSRFSPTSHGNLFFFISVSCS